jgi:chemotaxis signal transduction protein
LADQHLALEAARVRGILPPGELIPLPGIQKGLLGLTTLKGKTIAVIDLCGKLGLAGGNPALRQKIVIFEVIAGETRHVAAFMADRVSDVVVYRYRDLQNGILKGRGRPRRLIDCDHLVQEKDLAGLSAFSL